MITLVVLLLSISVHGELLSKIAGYWQGEVNTPWVPPYEVELLVWDDGQYSCHSKISSVPCFYYGSDFESPLKVLGVSENGTGFIDIFWAESKDTTRGELDLMQVTNSGQTLQFSFYNTWISNRHRYGPVKFTLNRVDENITMCEDYCEEQDICDFQTHECKNMETFISVSSNITAVEIIKNQFMDEVLTPNFHTFGVAVDNLDVYDNTSYPTNETLYCIVAFIPQPASLPATYQLVKVFYEVTGPICTMEAKVCWDGSTVGRTGPECEFSPCPLPSWRFALIVACVVVFIILLCFVCENAIFKMTKPQPAATV